MVPRAKRRDPGVQRFGSNDICAIGECHGESLRPVEFRGIRASKCRGIRDNLQVFFALGVLNLHVRRTPSALTIFRYFLNYTFWERKVAFRRFFREAGDLQSLAENGGS